MHRKGKFCSGQSYQRPFVVDAIREQSGKLHYGKSNSRALKRDTNRRIRRMPIDLVGDNGHYKRAVALKMWLYNGDLPDGLHHFIHPYPDEAIHDHVIIKGGKRYYPKR